MIFDRRRPDGQIANLGGGEPVRPDWSPLETSQSARTITEFTDRTRREAMGMIETAPVLILQGANYATAAGARTALERLGATVEVRTYGVETAGRPLQSSTSASTWVDTVLTIGGWVVLIILLSFIILVVVVSLIVASAEGDLPF
jgi:hypothetical protein